MNKYKIRNRFGQLKIKRKHSNIIIKKTLNKTKERFKKLKLLGELL